MRQRGFTIIELAIVMAVMAILLTLGTLGFRSYMAHARDKEREADILAIQNYLESIYPLEIKDDNGHVIKPAGAYPALMQEVDDGLDELSTIFNDLPSSATTPPGLQSLGIPSIPTANSGYIPGQGDVPYYQCQNYLQCYTRPNDINPTISEYYYAPGPGPNELCTKVSVANGGSVSGLASNCRSYVLIYKKETTGVRVVVESKRK